MLTLPEGGGDTLTFVGIDPGTDTMGVATIEVNIVTLQIVSTEAKTFHGSKLAKQGLKLPPWIASMHGNRFARIDALRDTLIRIYHIVRPFGIACESPFINNRFPQAGIALTEVVHAIRTSVYEYDPWLELTMVDPPSAKNAVGAKGNAKKEEVRDAVLAIAYLLCYVGEIALEDLDEHSIDSIAIAYYKYLSWMEQLCLK